MACTSSSWVVGVGSPFAALSGGGKPGTGMMPKSERERGCADGALLVVVSCIVSAPGMGGGCSNAPAEEELDTSDGAAVERVAPVRRRLAASGPAAKKAFIASCVMPPPILP